MCGSFKCEQECLRSFSEEDLTLEEAFALLDDMPEELWEHDATILLMSKIVKILDAKVDEQGGRVREGDCRPGRRGGSSGTDEQGDEGAGKNHRQAGGRDPETDGGRQEGGSYAVGG